MKQTVVVDTNILFSALLSGESQFAEILLTSDHRFIINELVLMELFSHKDKIARLSKLSEEEVNQLFL